MSTTSFWIIYVFIGIHIEVFLNISFNFFFDLLVIYEYVIYLSHGCEFSKFSFVTDDKLNSILFREHNFELFQTYWDF